MYDTGPVVEVWPAWPCQWPARLGTCLRAFRAPAWNRPLNWPLQWQFLLALLLGPLHMAKLSTLLDNMCQDSSIAAQEGDVGPIAEKMRKHNLYQFARCLLIQYTRQPRI